MSLENNQNNEDMNSQAVNDFSDKVSALKMLMQYDLIGCDAKWTLFVAAAQSYRYESELIPFPTQFQTTKGSSVEHNINALIATISETPRLHVFWQMLQDGKEAEINADVLDLTYWVLITNNLPFLRLLNKNELTALLQRLELTVDDCQLPTHAFELQELQGTNFELQFEESRLNFNTGFGFYGNQLDTFFSLVHNGFDKFQCPKNNFTGPVLELMPTLELCAAKSPSSAAWGFSACGSIISCIGLCEYVANPHFMKLKTYEGPVGELHCEKIELTNSDLVRLRYLFFYGNRTTDIKEKSTPPPASWAKRNSSYLSIAATLAVVVTTLVATERGAVIKDFCTSSLNKAVKFCRNIVSFNLRTFK